MPPILLESSALYQSVARQQRESEHVVIFRPRFVLFCVAHIARPEDNTLFLLLPRAGAAAWGFAARRGV